ncbi:unnamed protein product [Schistosoma mattheei]|uniref:Helix-turn-helix domain-containing protein n=1 Tax=Schistosoma mattheei TaxID=31246 RepID=A0A183PNZ5_9TREM|nr:unnamed protein product [Schistosoma mattheei]
MIKQICSNGTIDDELLQLRQTLIRNGYPRRFAERKLTPTQHPEKAPAVQKKTLYVQVDFKVPEKKPSAQSFIVFSSRPTIHVCVKD